MTDIGISSIGISIGIERKNLRSWRSKEALTSATIPPASIHVIDNRISAPKQPFLDFQPYRRHKQALATNEDKNKKMCDSFAAHRELKGADTIQAKSDIDIMKSIT